MTRRIVFLGALAAMLVAGRLVRAAESLRIVPLATGRIVVVTIELSDTNNDDLRQAISSGLRTTFTYDIELRMVVPTWDGCCAANCLPAIRSTYRLSVAVSFTTRFPRTLGP